MRSGGVRAASAGVFGLAAGGLAVASATMGTLLTWDCPVRAAFGVECPGCGSTRCVQAIVRGDLLEAVRHNALTSAAIMAILSVAAIGIIAPSSLVVGLRRVRPTMGCVILAMTTLIAIFTLVRNVI